MLYLCLPLSQVQSIVDIANSAFSLLQKLSASLRATSKTAVGTPTYLPWGASVFAVICCHVWICCPVCIVRMPLGLSAQHQHSDCAVCTGIADLVPFLSGVTSIDDQAANLNNTASDVDRLVASGTNSVAQIQTKGIGVGSLTKVLLVLPCVLYCCSISLCKQMSCRLTL